MASPFAFEWGCAVPHHPRQTEKRRVREGASHRHSEGGNGPNIFVFCPQISFSSTRCQSSILLAWSSHVRRGEPKMFDKIDSPLRFFGMSCNDCRIAIHRRWEIWAHWHILEKFPPCASVCASVKWQCVHFLWGLAANCACLARPDDLVAMRKEKSRQRASQMPQGVTHTNQILMNFLQLVGMHNLEYLVERCFHLRERVRKFEPSMQWMESCALTLAIKSIWCDSLTALLAFAVL